MGHKRVRVAESQQPETSLLSIDFKSDMEDDETPMAEEMGFCITVRRTRPTPPPGRKISIILSWSCVSVFQFAFNFFILTCRRSPMIQIST